MAVDRIIRADRSDLFHWKNGRPHFDASDERSGDPYDIDDPGGRSSDPFLMRSDGNESIICGKC